MVGVSEGQLRLQDGRLLGYAEFGDEQGQPVFYFHGLPGSRLEARFLDQKARIAGLRVIAVDRPGFGRSSFAPGRVLADWPNDMTELADALGVDHFAVVGNSGGGPYAAACARYLQKRLTGVVIVCGIGPPEAFEAAAERLLWSPRAFRQSSLVLGLFVRLAVLGFRHFPGLMFKAVATKVSEPDRKVLGVPWVRDTLQASLQEGVRQGPRAGLQDLQLLFARSWDFRLDEIPSEVFLWYGESDRVVPPTVGVFLKQAIPKSHLFLLPEEGHFSLPINHMEDIFQTVANFSRKGRKAVAEGSQSAR